MNMEQRKAAQQEMIGWLTHPQELGKAPAKIECAGTFTLYEMTYYIFKYKKSLWGKWLLGVCGGYEGDSLDHCGHVFSQMEEYDEGTAVEQAKALVEYVRQYYMEQAEKAEERKQNAGTFVNFVLLEDAAWDKEALLRDLKERWQIEDEPEEAADGDEPEAGGGDDENIFCIQYRGALIAVSFMPGPVPEEEVVYHAQSNYMWKDGVETVKKHQAHLLVAVMGKAISPLEAGTLLVKTVTSCCRQAGVLGIYANETVYQPELYLDFAGLMEKDLLPLCNLVWFGLYGGEKGICGYTCGLQGLGYDEIEILDSTAQPSEVRDFLMDIAGYVLTEDVTLRDGETIGFTADQKLPITLSQGVMVEGNSLKIGF